MRRLTAGRPAVAIAFALMAASSAGTSEEGDGRGIAAPEVLWRVPLPTPSGLACTVGSEMVAVMRGTEPVALYDADGPVLLDRTLEPSAVAVHGDVLYTTNYNRVRALSHKGEELWSFDVWEHAPEKPAEGTYPEVSHPVTGADGAVYLTTGIGYAYCLEPDGTLRWVRPSGNTHCLEPFPLGDDALVVFGLEGPPTILTPDGPLPWPEGVVAPRSDSLAGSADGCLLVPRRRALAAYRQDGSLAWARDLPGLELGGRNEGSGASVGPGGRIYIGAGRALCCLSPDGGVLWWAPTEGVALERPLIGRDGAIYVATRQRDPEAWRLEAFDHGGRALWRMDLPHLVYNHYLVIGADEVLYAVLSTGGPLIDLELIAVGQARTDGAHPGVQLLPDRSGEADLEREGLAESPWPCVGRDARHSGRGDGTVIASPRVRWQFETGAPVRSSPVIAADGLILFGSNDGHLYAADRSGNERWSYQAGAMILGGAAVASNGVIYVASYDGRLHALSPGGLPLWTFDTGAPVCGSPVVARDGTVLIGNRSGSLHAVSHLGEPVWTFEAVGAIDSAPAIGPNGSIYVAATSAGWQGTLHAVTPSGEGVWQVATDAAVHCAPSVGPDGTVFVGDDSGIVYAVSPTGDVLRHYGKEGPLGPFLAIDHHGRVLAEDRHGNVVAYAGGHGSSDRAQNQDWELPPGSPVIDWSGAVLACANGLRGGELWRITDRSRPTKLLEAPNWILSQPAIDSDGTVYVGCQDGRLYAVGE